MELQSAFYWQASWSKIYLSESEGYLFFLFPLFPNYFFEPFIVCLIAVFLCLVEVKVLLKSAVGAFSLIHRKRSSDFGANLHRVLV